MTFSLSIIGLHSFRQSVDVLLGFALETLAAFRGAIFVKREIATHLTLVIAADLVHQPLAAVRVF
jgi:hypothetical protein